MSWIDPYPFLAGVMHSLRQLVMNISHACQIMQFSELEQAQDKRSSHVYTCMCMVIYNWLTN